MQKSGEPGLVYKHGPGLVQPPAPAANGDNVLAHAPADDGAAYDWSGWEAWLAGHLALEREKMLEGVAEGVMLILESRDGNRAAELAKLRESLARVEGQMETLTAMLGLKVDAVGSGFKGEKGEQGPRGDRGPRGAQGPPGRDGTNAPTWTSVTFDSKVFAFVPRMSDGSVGPRIELRDILSGVRLDRKSYSIVATLSDGAELRFSLRELFEQYDVERRGA
jgi:hypothetical protein